MLTRTQFNRLKSDYKKSYNAEGHTACGGCPQAVIQANFSYTGWTKQNCTAECCRCGRCSVIITGNIDFWDSSHPWIGPAGPLKNNYPPEQLIKHADRFVTDWSEYGAPETWSVERTTLNLSVAKQMVDRSCPVVLPELDHPARRNPAALQWLEEIRWKGGPSSITAWRAKRPLRMTGEITLSADLPIVVTPDLGSSWVWMADDRDRSHNPGKAFATRGSVDLSLDEGDVVFIGTHRGTRNLEAEGTIVLNVGDPSVAPIIPLQKRIVAARADVSRAAATEAWKASPLSRLRLVFGGPSPEERYMVNLHGETAEREREFAYAGTRVHALPDDLWWEIIRRDTTDRERYVWPFQTDNPDEIFQCGDYSTTFKMNVANNYNVNGVAVVADTSAGTKGHAYVARQVIRDDGSLYWQPFKAQVDADVTPYYRTAHFRGLRGFALV